MTILGGNDLVPADDQGPWPAVAQPHRLLGEITDWLSGYGNHATRRTYAEGLGLPTSPTDLREWITTPDGDWAAAITAYAALVTTATRPATHAPPPAPRGRFRPLHWFRWCASRGIDPQAATATHVKTWLADLDTAGAAPATRDRMLATVKALYTHLADTGLAAGNPAALNRRRLGLVAPTGSTASTVVLTTGQVRALFATASATRRGASLLDTARATAVVGLFTLGLRVSELCALDRDDLHVTRGRRALRVSGKGGKNRVVYLHETAERALLGYLRLRDHTSTETAPATPDRTAPLLITRTGGRYQRQGVWQLLRRIAVAAGEPLRDVADAMHPHALRHFYVTTAVEAGAQLVHIQADVGHTSVDTTEQVYNNAARDPGRSAVDLVGDALRT
ncbi:integrase [Actinophytocola xinjiangensis]|uniref:Integrase n=1 Tax=Actinophytocola xinjiangensis TaxID=485602 RepID=A0A7Z0WJW0_9PSEU|nr:tyrosine-type recombinase/integrase [Actinophytocola xinjiangensis]OLF06829.1 integrase [Actinophytocola xinjiangensis]